MRQFEAGSHDLRASLCAKAVSQRFPRPSARAFVCQEQWRSRLRVRRLSFVLSISATETLRSLLLHPGRSGSAVKDGAVCCPRSIRALCRGSNRRVDTSASAGRTRKQEHDRLVLGPLVLVRRGRLEAVGCRARNCAKATGQLTSRRARTEWTCDHRVAKAGAASDRKLREGCRVPVSSASIASTTNSHAQRFRVCRGFGFLSM